MYKELHTFYHDIIAERQHVYSTDGKFARTDYDPMAFYRPGQSMLLRLDTIKSITNELPDTDELKRICISDDHTEDIIVSKAEAEEITKALVNQSDDELPEQLNHLCRAIRDLTNLLHARLR